VSFSWPAAFKKPKGARIAPRMTQAIEDHPLLAVVYPLVKQSAVYLVGTGLVGLGNFLLVPLFTRYLTLADFGVYSLIEIALLITVTMAQLGMGTSYVRWYAESAAARRGELLATCGFAAVTAGAGAGCVLVLLAGSLGFRWLGPLHGMQWIFLPLVIFKNLQGLLFCVLQASQRATAYSAAAATRLLALSGAGIWFVAVHREGIRGVLFSWLVGDSVCLLLLLVFCVPGQRLRVDLALLKPILKYGYPLVWSVFMGLLLDASCRFFLAKYQSLAEVGLYAIGIKITGIFAMGFLQPFGSAWIGIAFSIAHRPNAPVTYTKILGYALVVAMFLIAAAILFGPYLVVLFAGRAYLSATRLLPWVLLPIALRLLEYWGSLPFYLKYETRWLGPLATVGVLVCFALNALLVPRFGVFGAAWAWVGALAANIFVLTLAARRYFPLPIDWKTAGFAASLWAAALVESRVTAGLSPLSYFCVSSVTVALLLLACVGYFHRDVRVSRSLFTEGAYAD